jgi:hypothetical protein
LPPHINLVERDYYYYYCEGEVHTPNVSLPHSEAEAERESFVDEILSLEMTVLAQQLFSLSLSQNIGPERGKGKTCMRDD